MIETATPSFWSRNRFIILLGVLLLLLAMAPGLHVFQIRRFPGLSSGIFTASFSAVLVSAVFAVESGKHARRMTLGLVAATIVLRVLAKVVGGTALIAVSQLAAALFLGLTIFLIVNIVFRSRVANMDTIAGALCAYLLLGLFYATLYSLAGDLDPEAFRMTSPTETMSFEGASAITPIYFSYVTLTTLGYGDVVPISPVARALVLIETIVGQIFLIVLVARLVGINVAQTTSSDPD